MGRPGAKKRNSCLQSYNRAIVLRRDLHVVHHVAPVHGVHHILLPALDPLDRAACNYRHERHDEVFREDVQLGAEPATHVGRNHAHVVFGYA